MSAYLESVLPTFPMGGGIPKRMYHTYPNIDLPQELQANIDRNRALNSGWDIEIFDDAAINNFIIGHYGKEIHDIYSSLNPSYGAARADLFRYLLIYRNGGVYLDVKSGMTRPLDQIITADDTYILSHWDNRPESDRAGWGLHDSLSHVPGGEFQQWHVIAVSGHPLLRAVIVSVLRNIREYSAWTMGVRQQGVINTTGPIAYTKAIFPILGDYPHREVRSDKQVGLSYSCVEDFTHKRFFASHYTKLWQPLVLRSGLSGLADKIFCGLAEGRNDLAVKTYPWRRRLRGEKL